MRAVSIAVIAVGFGNIGLAQSERLVLENPVEDEEVGDSITLKGTAPPRTVVKYQIEWWGLDATGREDHGILTSGNTGVRDGPFQEGPIDLEPEITEVTQAGAQVQGYRILCAVSGATYRVAAVRRKVYRSGSVPSLTIQTPDPNTPLTDGVMPLAGAAKPYSKLGYRITWTADGQQGVAAEGRLAAGRDGTFRRQVRLTPSPPNLREAEYRLDCWIEGSSAPAQSVTLGVTEVPFRVTAPAEGQEVSDAVVVQGEAAPGSRVECELWWVGPGREGDRGLLVQTTVPTAENGSFEVRMPVTPKAPDTAEINALRLRVFQPGKEDHAQERMLAYHWSRPRLPETLQAKVLRVQFPQPLVVEYEGMQVQLAVPPETPVTWAGRRVTRAELKPGFVLEIALGESDSPTSGVARAIVVLEPPPVSQTHGAVSPAAPDSRRLLLIVAGVSTGLLILLMAAMMAILVKQLRAARKGRGEIGDRPRS